MVRKISFNNISIKNSMNYFFKICFFALITLIEISCQTVFIDQKNNQPTSNNHLKTDVRDFLNDPINHLKLNNFIITSENIKINQLQKDDEVYALIKKDTFFHKYYYLNIEIGYLKYSVVHNEKHDWTSILGTSFYQNHEFSSSTSYLPIKHNLTVGNDVKYVKQFLGKPNFQNKDSIYYHLISNELNANVYIKVHNRKIRKIRIVYE